MDRESDNQQEKKEVKLEELHEIISPQEMEQFYILLEKMQKLSSAVENSNESSSEKPSSITITVNASLIKQGESVTVADELLEKIQKHYQIPIYDNSDEFLIKLFSSIEISLEKTCSEYFINQKKGNNE
jgi:hypothetical protein